MHGATTTLIAVINAAAAVAAAASRHHICLCRRRRHHCPQRHHFHHHFHHPAATPQDGYPGRVYFVDGLASFEGLYINDQGSGFVIEFIVLDDSDATVTSAESAEFEVAIGSAYQISLSTYPGSATGGSGFSPQPVVAAKDIGGNTVTSYGEGQVTAYLVDTQQNPNPTGAVLRGTTTRSMNSGLVTFTDLYINEAGSPYLLAFEFS